MSQSSGSPAFDIGRMFGTAWNVFQRNAVAYVVAMVIYLVIVIVIAVVNTAVNEYVGYALNALVAGPLMLGLAQMALEGVRGRAIQPADILSGFGNFIHAFLANLLLSVFTIIGFMLCVIPGFLVIILYSATYMFMYDRQYDFWSAMEASRKLVMSNFVQWLIVVIIAFALAIVGAILCGIGLLVTAPLAMLMIALAYEQSRGVPAEVIAEEPAL